MTGAGGVENGGERCRRVRQEKDAAAEGGDKPADRQTTRADVAAEERDRTRTRSGRGRRLDLEHPAIDEDLSRVPGVIPGQGQRAGPMLDDNAGASQRAANERVRAATHVADAQTSVYVNAAK